MKSTFTKFKTVLQKVPRICLHERQSVLTSVEINGMEVVVKRDDQRGRYYGGNKVRKLEYILADAREKNQKALITFGCVGSNHALATALYARQLGFACTCCLLPQPNSAVVRKNLSAQASQGAALHFFKNGTVMKSALPDIEKDVQKRHGAVRVIPPGGSEPLGVLGFAAAAIECIEQCQQLGIALPSDIYIPAGTCGTAAGLILGFSEAGLPLRVHAVQVTDGRFSSPDIICKLIAQTQHYIKQFDATYHGRNIYKSDFCFRPEFFGTGYGFFTPQGCEAIKRAEAVGVELEGTYTAKAFAALLHDHRVMALGKQPMYWHTYNTLDLGPLVHPNPEQVLEKGLGSYFLQDCDFQACQ